MGKRNYRIPRIIFYNLIIAAFIAVVLWAGHLTDSVPLQDAIRYSAITSLALCASYALYRFILTSPSRWRVTYILLGTFCIGFVLWVVFMLALRRVFGLDTDSAALISFSPAYPLGAYLGDKLGKRRNYRNPFVAQ